MLHLWTFRCSLLLLLLGQFHFRYISATWPISNTSSIQILGLFPDRPNASHSDNTTLSVHSRAMFTAAVVLSQQLNITIDDHLIGWHAAQTSGIQIGALSATCRAMSITNIVGIVGPAFSRETLVTADLSATIGIPVISYAATDPGLSDKSAYPSFHRTVPSDNTAALAFVKLFLQYNWTSCNIIYQNDDFGIGGADSISSTFAKHGLTVSQTLLFDISTNTFRHNIKDVLQRSSSRIVIVWTDVVYTPTVIQYGLDNDVIGPQFLWILCSSIPLNVFNQSSYSKLVGLMTLEPTVGNKIGVSINTTLLDAAYALWEQYEPETFPGPDQVNNYALFAFDATWSLILSLQKLCSSPVNASSSCLSFSESAFCFDQRFVNSESFMNIISGTDFVGVSGLVQFSSNTTDRIRGGYYIIQNVQAFSNELGYVSVLAWNGSGNWTNVIGSSVILWPGISLKPPTGYPALNSITLRIGVPLVAPFAMETNITDEFGNIKTQLSGYAIDVIEVLREKMGFVPQIIATPKNYTFDQLIQAVADNVYDMLVGDVTITAKRRLTVDFSASIFDGSLRIITQNDATLGYDLLSFMKPFSPRLWLLILGTFFYAALLFWIMERRKNEALRRRSLISATTMSLWFIFGNLVGYGADYDVRTAAGRLLTVGLYILSIILIASYTANLASDLTVTKSQNTITGLSDIKNGKVPYNRIGIVVGSSIEDYYLREISSGSRNYYPLTSQADIYSCLLNNTIDVSIFDAGLLEYAVHSTYCNLTLVGSDFDPSAYGIVIRKDWLYTQALDVTILSLRENGTLGVLTRKWFTGGSCADSSTTSTTTSFTIESLAGLFLTFAVISVLSLLLFVWLNRSSLKDYLWKCVQGKGKIIEKNISIEVSPTRIDNETAQSHKADRIAYHAARL